MAADTTAMGVHHCFEGGTVVSRLDSLEKFAAIKELIHRAPVFQEIANLPAFEESVISREKLQSTGFGHGVAVAHGRVENLPRVLIALGISAPGIPFGAPDGEPVKLLFLIASPTQTTLDYLQALSNLVKVVRDCSLRSSLLSAEDDAIIEKTIRDAFACSLERVGCP